MTDDATDGAADTRGDALRERAAALLADPSLRISVVSMRYAGGHRVVLRTGHAVSFFVPLDMPLDVYAQAVDREYARRLSDAHDLLLARLRMLDQRKDM